MSQAEGPRRSHALLAGRPPGRPHHSTAWMHACFLRPHPCHHATAAPPHRAARSFLLLNNRQDYQLALVSNSSGTPTVLAVSPVMRNKVPNQPTLIHLAPGAVPTAG